MILEENIWHIYPNNDLAEHITKCDVYNAGGIKAFCICKCNPEHKLIDKDGIPTGILIIHNSFDGREGVEWVNELLKQTK